MFVAVQHTIDNPEAFWAKAGEIVPNLPPEVKLHQCFPNKNGTRGICIWEAESIKAVQTYLDGQVGHVSSNDYFEVENRDSIALPTAIAATTDANRSTANAPGFGEERPFA